MEKQWKCGACAALNSEFMPMCERCSRPQNFVSKVSSAAPSSPSPVKPVPPGSLPRPTPKPAARAPTAPSPSSASKSPATKPAPPRGAAAPSPAPVRFQGSSLAKFGPCMICMNDGDVPLISFGACPHPACEECIESDILNQVSGNNSGKLKCLNRCHDLQDEELRVIAASDIIPWAVVDRVQNFAQDNKLSDMAIAEGNKIMHCLKCSEPLMLGAGDSVGRCEGRECRNGASCYEHLTFYIRATGCPTCVRIQEQQQQQRRDEERAAAEAQRLAAAAEADRQRIAAEQEAERQRIQQEREAAALRDRMIHDENANLALLRQDTKQCPRCMHGVFKNGGCNHMSCRCGHQFYYCCIGNYPGGCRCG